MSDRFQVHETESLMQFLNHKLQGWSRSKIKKRLQGNCVLVNGEPVRHHDHALAAGDAVEVIAANTVSAKKGTQQGLPQLEILFSDSDLIAINKPAGLLSVASAKENKRHAMAILRRQLSRTRREIKLWPVHRLDRDTSGVLLFATSRDMREAVNALWHKADKIYLAVVERCPNPAQATINQPLHMDEHKYHMHVGSHPNAKRAVTHFKTLQTATNRSLLEVKLETGRQHQIRAHLAWLGHAVIGDPRYGTEGPRLGLHAQRLTITHPQRGKRLTFDTPAPYDFSALLTGC